MSMYRDLNIVDAGRSILSKYIHDYSRGDKMNPSSRVKLIQYAVLQRALLLMIVF